MPGSTTPVVKRQEGKGGGVDLGMSGLLAYGTRACTCKNGRAA